MASGKPATVKQLDDAVALMGKTGSGPVPTDPFVSQAWLMSNVHAVMLSCLRHIYLTAPSIKPKDQNDFVGYCLFWVSMLHEHHELEETWYFPTINNAVPVEMIEGEHAVFEKPLHAFEEYLLSCLPGGTLWGGQKKVVPQDSPNSTFESAKLLGIIDELVPSFVPHFCAEIGYLDPKILRTKLTHQDFENLDKRHAIEVPKIPKAFHVFVVLHTHSRHFPPAPWWVINILIPWVLYWPDRRCWRFAPPKVYWDSII